MASCYQRGIYPLFWLTDFILIGFSQSHLLSLERWCVLWQLVNFTGFMNEQSKGLYLSEAVETISLGSTQSCTVIHAVNDVVQVCKILL